MASPSTQPSLDALSGRRFSFYPAIRNIEHNEWTLAEETWSEMMVVNAGQELDIWVPRKYVSGISSSDSPVLIVGLNRELEFRAGAVWPYRPKVVSIPNRRPAPPSEIPANLSAPPSGRRPSLAAESSIGRLVGTALTVGVFLCLIAVLFVYKGTPSLTDMLFRADTSTTDQRYLGLTATDRYYDIALKLDAPESREWISPEDAQIHFEVLRYPARRYIVILMGASREDARYIGTLHAESRTALDTVPLNGGGTTASMLKNMPTF